MRRVLATEWLDHLPPDDPEARASRRDLRRINAWMGNRRWMERAWSELPFEPRTVVELGAGDGRLMLQLARRRKHPATILLVDLQPLITSETIAAYHALGWKVETCAADAATWLRAGDRPQCDLLIANLFLHHFTDDALRSLLAGIAQTTRAFIACEPRRSRLALFATRLLWLIGCNRITRHDAPASVQAGFTARELSALWPPHSGFTLQECAAGYSSHLFQATAL